MPRKQPLPLSKTKIYITGYYRDNQGKKKYGFVKRDARKKQSVWIKDTETLIKYRLPSLTKKELKSLRKNVDKYIQKKYKTFKGKKIEQVEPEIKEVILPVSKPFDRRVDKGEYRRIEAMGVAEKPEDFRNNFFSAFTQGVKLNADFVVINIYLQITFKHRRRYSYKTDFFIFSRRYFIDMEKVEIQNQFTEILKKLQNRLTDMKTEYQSVIKKIQYINKNEWLIKNEEKIK